MGKFYKMMKHYAEKSGGDKEKMWKSVECLDEHFEEFEEAHKEDFWDLMRELHEINCGPHFNEEFARWEVCEMKSVDINGNEQEGEYWNVKQVEAAIEPYKKMIPAENTIWDCYYALNAFWHDLSETYQLFAKENDLTKEVADSLVVRSAIKFFFMDIDGAKGKAWLYAKAMDGNE